LPINAPSLLWLPLASPQWSSCQFMSPVFYGRHWQAHSHRPVNSWPQLLILVASGKPAVVILPINAPSLLWLPLTSSHFHSSSSTAERAANCTPRFYRGD
jgi:hypothetical protein